MHKLNALLESHTLRLVTGDLEGTACCQAVCLLSSLRDVADLSRGCLVFCGSSFLMGAGDPGELLVSAMHKAEARGLVMVASAAPRLSEQSVRRLQALHIFVLQADSPAEFYRAYRELSGSGAPEFDFDALNQFRSELAECYLRQCSAKDIAAFLNTKIRRHPLDLIFGRYLENYIQHNTLGIMHVSAVVQNNLEKIFAGPVFGVYYYGSSSALVVRIAGLYAFLAIPVEEGNPISDLELAYLEEAIPYLELSLLTSRSVGCGDSVGQLFLNLLRGIQPPNALALRKSASILGIDYDAPRRVWVLEYSQQTEEITFERVRRIIRDMFPESFVYGFSNRFVVVSNMKQVRNGPDTPEQLFCRILKAFYAALPEARLHLGFSNICSNLRHLQDAYAEAKFSMIIGPMLDPGRQIYAYRTYMLYHIICNSWGAPILSRIHSRFILPLRKFDQENDTQLLATLELYSRLAFNIARTAEALQIHRNTLYHRIAKAGSLISQDLNTSEAQIMLYIALRIHHIIEIYPRTESDISWTL